MRQQLLQRLRRLRMELHEALGLHDFAWTGGPLGYHPRCGCGAYMNRWK
ncbi:MAG TPA: hypothetical protein VI589_06975 [Vicinamibacteria bacterium]